MSESFSDAKVIRSDETILTLQELRLLLSNLESGENTPRDLTTLTSISTKIDDALGEYGEKYYASISAARRKTRELTSQDSLQDIDRALGLIIARLDDELGNDPAPDILFKISEWDWMKDRWEGNKKLSGDREMRVKLIRIYDALVNAKGVRFVGKNKIAWVKGEPEPIHEQAASA